MSNKILQCCSKQFKEKASMSNYLPRVLDCRETSTFGQPQLHTGTNCGGLAVLRGRFFSFFLLPSGHFGAIISTYESRCGASSQSNVPSRAGESWFISFLLQHLLMFTPFSTWGTILFLICPWTRLPWILLPERQEEHLPASNQIIY